MSARNVVDVMGSPIDLITWERAVSEIIFWGINRQSKVVCICNVHSIITAGKDVELSSAILSADMATPDGAPVAWYIRRHSGCTQDRINGPDLMLKVLDEINSNPPHKKTSIYLYGGSPSTLDVLREKLAHDFPGVLIAGYYSPPFRVLTEHEEQEVVRKINESGAGIVWVGLGCPKQEKWMSNNKGKVSAVMIGVGAAFDYHAGVIKRAPLWMQKNGLEWFHRLCSEPKRLWRRYFSTNSIFIVRVVQGFLRDYRR